MKKAAARLASRRRLLGGSGSAAPSLRRLPASVPSHATRLQAHVEAQPLPQVVPQLLVGAQAGLDARGGALQGRAGERKGGGKGRHGGCARSLAVRGRAPGA